MLTKSNNKQTVVDRTRTKKTFSRFKRFLLGSPSVNGRRLYLSDHMLIANKQRSMKRDTELIEHDALSNICHLLWIVVHVANFLSYSSIFSYKFCETTIHSADVCCDKKFDKQKSDQEVITQKTSKLHVSNKWIKGRSVVRRTLNKCISNHKF
jgi:hypothetical protein